jgi:hypothetical protein
MASATTLSRSDEFDAGDFQTPCSLADRVWRILPASSYDLVLEPTVGLGAFVGTAPRWARAARWFCLDINPRYVALTKAILTVEGFQGFTIEHADVFALKPADLARAARAARSLLVIGNPPWVTSAAIAAGGGTNRPRARKQLGFSRLDSLTGRSNFDLAEAVIHQVLEAGCAFERIDLALLVKESVAMRVLDTFGNDPQFVSLSFSRIDATREFGVSVSAGLLQLSRVATSAASEPRLVIRESLGGPVERVAGLVGRQVVADIDSFRRRPRALSTGDGERWRQGVKHDLARVLEFELVDGRYRNGLGELVELEPGVMAPLYKSSDIANGRTPRKWFPLYQRDLQDDLSSLAGAWPLLAAYLERHSEAFAHRGSRIYAKKPLFALFGVGDYTWAPYKVAVAGMYRQPVFRVLCPDDGRAPLVDDTCYLLPFDRRQDAETVAGFLNSSPVAETIDAIVVGSAKRPITARVLSCVWVPDAASISAQDAGDYATRPALTASPLG